MTVLVLENIAALPRYANSARSLLSRLARKLDVLVSARAAREVPEWRVRQVRREINRYQAIVGAGKMRRNRQAGG